MCENGCGLRPWQEPLFWLSLFSTLWDFLQHPSAPVERGAGEGRAALTSCLLRLKPDFHSLLQKMAPSAGTGEVWPGLQTQIAVSLLAVAASRSPAPLPRLGSWERRELRAVIAGPDGAEVSSDWLLFTHLPGALFLQVSKRDRKWVANELWCPSSKHATFECCFPRVNISYSHCYSLSYGEADIWQRCRRICLYLSGIEYQVCISVQETEETAFTQLLAFTHISIKSAVQTTGNSMHRPPFHGDTTLSLSFAFGFCRWRTTKCLCVFKRQQRISAFCHPRLSASLPVERLCLSYARISSRLKR